MYTTKMFAEKYMAVIKCPECKKKISNQCGNCPNCGFPIKINVEKDEVTSSHTPIVGEVVGKKKRKIKQFIKPANQKLLIVAIGLIVIALLLIGFICYDALLPRINTIKDFNAAVDVVVKKNYELDSKIKQSEDLILEEKPLLDESLTPALEMAISDAKAAKVSNFKKPSSVEDVIARTKELNIIDYTSVLTNLNEKHEAVVTDAQRYQLVNHPTESYVIQCLKTIPEIINISAVTEENDPIGNLNKSGSYTASVYFSVKSINLDKSIYGETLIEQGTDAGGGIEVYTCVEDAVKRRDYLATFDGGILASGTHTVVGTVLVRTSDKLTATQQKDLEARIIEALTYLPKLDKTEIEDTTLISNISTTKKSKYTDITQKSTQQHNKNKEAVKAAEDIADFYATVYPGLVKELLVSDYGYSETQALYAIKHANIDWNNYCLIHLEDYVRIKAGNVTKSEVERYLTIEKGYSDSNVKYAFANTDVNWSKTSVGSTRPSISPNNRDADAIEEAIGMACYDYTATPAEIEKRLVSELGFSLEDAKYCVDRIDNLALEGSRYNWVERVEYYVKYELQDYYIEYTWCYNCEEVYGVYNTCPICGREGTETGQLAFGYTRADVVSKLKNEGFSDSDIQAGLKNVPSDKFYDESKYKKP